MAAEALTRDCTSCISNVISDHECRSGTVYTCCASCSYPSADCDNNGGCETDLSSDANNCGGCGDGTVKGPEGCKAV